MIGVLPDGAIQSSYQGSLSLGNGDRFHLRLPGQEICSDGATLWQYSVTQHQVLIKNSADMEGGLHPSEMLFRYLRCKPMNIRQDKFQGVPVHILELDASQQIKSLTSMEVWLKDSDQTPVKLITVDKTGSSVIYSISNLRKNSTLNDQTFQFQAPAGVEEIDMR
ncbi:MAG TPA: outer membrane lipoprotein carrier protein LolA [Fibrobacteraceae bacterium]|nr:outer membrane lipoprotein carrier protein LolA [Fibrobacteraceae bacterium]